MGPFSFFFITSIFTRMTFGLGREIFLPATPVPDNQDLIFLERKSASDKKKNLISVKLQKSRAGGACGKSPAQPGATQRLRKPRPSPDRCWSNYS